MQKTKRFTICGLGIWLLGSISVGWAQDEPEKSEIGFTIQSGSDRSMDWGVKFPKGEQRDLSEQEEEQLFKTTIFPRVLRDANEGKEPEVWQIGFFYLDGKGTEADLQKAEAAFRKGMDIGRPDGLLFLGDYFQEQGIAARENPQERDENFARAEEIYREVLAEGFAVGSRYAIPLASAYLFGWYELEPDAEKADSILQAVEAAAPEDPSTLFWRAKVFIEQKRFPEAFDYAERAQNGFAAMEQRSEKDDQELKHSRAVKITAAVLGGEVSKIDPDEFLQISKESLGLTGRMAWSVPILLLALLLFLLWRTRKKWELDDVPGLRLSIVWISAAVLAAGIGFNIRLSGLDNGFGHWIGAILVTVITLVAMSIAGWGRYFGSDPLYRGVKPILIGLGIIVVGIVGMQLIAAGYGKLYELVLGKGLDQQLVSLFLKNETILGMLGTLVIVGIAIPFYEEVFFRGFLCDALEKRWSTKTALIVSSVGFAIVHGITFFVPLLFLSFALGWLRMRNGNLRMCFFLHAANNSFAVIVGHFSGS